MPITFATLCRFCGNQAARVEEDGAELVRCFFCGASYPFMK